jgi:hypothetical protein
MTETQLRLFPAFQTLPVYDERDEQRSHSLTAGLGKSKSVRECVTMAEVEECLANPKLVPLGAVRAGADGKQVVIVYFGELT